MTRLFDERFHFFIRNLVVVGALASAEAKGRREVAKSIPHKTKHGPSGRGGAGDCDVDCAKCVAEEVIRQTRNVETYALRILEMNPRQRRDLRRLQGRAKTSADVDPFDRDDLGGEG